MTPRKLSELDDVEFRELLLAAGRRAHRPPPGASDRAITEVTRRVPLVGVDLRGHARSLLSIACGALAAAAFAVSLRTSPPQLSPDTYGAGGVGTAAARQLDVAPQSVEHDSAPVAATLRIIEVGAGRM